MVLLAAGCGGRHTVHGDAEADAPGDADGDWDPDGAPEADVDNEADAELDTSPDADETVDADRDWDPEDRTWLHLWPRGEVYALTGVVPHDGRSILVSGVSDDSAWVGRLDTSGAEVWSSSIGGLPASRADQVNVTGAHTLAVVVGTDENRWLAELDVETGFLRSQVSVSLAAEAGGAGPALGGLPDGSLLLAFGSRERGVEVARYSFDDGILWSRLLVEDDYLGYFPAMSVGATGATFLSWRIGVAPWHGSVVAALGSDGELLWARRVISEECGGLVWGVAATEDGGVVLAGRGSGAGCGVWLVKLDAAGGEEWAIFVGDYIEGMFHLSDGEAAFGVAVGSAGEVLAVGLTTDGAPPNRQDALALWVHPSGEVRRMVRIQDLEGGRMSSAYVPAAVPGGGWLIGGVYYSGTPFLASLDAEGRLDHDCENIHEVSLPARSVPLGGAFLDLPVEEGSLVVGDSDLVVEETTTTAERLCD